MSIIVRNCQHCDEQQFETLSCVHYTIFSVVKLYEFIRALLLDRILVLEKNYAYVSCTYCFQSYIWIACPQKTFKKCILSRALFLASIAIARYRIIMHDQSVNSNWGHDPDLPRDNYEPMSYRSHQLCTESIFSNKGMSHVDLMQLNIKDLLSINVPLLKYDIESLLFKWRINYDISMFVTYDDCDLNGLFQLCLICLDLETLWNLSLSNDCSVLF